jgi:hypothetical protein
VAVYDKHDYLPERRQALDLWWSNEIAVLERGENFNVVPLRQAAHDSRRDLLAGDKRKLGK